MTKHKDPLGAMKTLMAMVGIDFDPGTHFVMGKDGSIVQLRKVDRVPLPPELEPNHEHWYREGYRAGWTGSEQAKADELGAGQRLAQQIDTALQPGRWRGFDGPDGTSKDEVIDDVVQALMSYRLRTAIEPPHCLNVHHNATDCDLGKLHWSMWCEPCGTAGRRKR